MIKQQNVVFCGKLRALMKEKGLKQHHLVTRFGVTQAAVSRWYTTSIPGPEILPDLADFLGVTVDYLLSEQQPVVSHQPHPNRNRGSDLTTQSHSDPLGHKNIKIDAIEGAVAEVRAASEGLMRALEGLVSQLKQINPPKDL